MRIQAKESSRDTLLDKSFPLDRLTAIDFKKASIGQLFIWETFGTCFLTIAALSNGTDFGKVIAISIAFVISYQVCGSQLNPAVTLMALLSKGIDLTTFFLNIFAQCLGAFLATFLLYATNVHNDFLGPPGIDPDLIDAQGFIQEAIGSFLFILFIQIQFNKGTEYTKDIFQTAMYFACILFTGRQLASGSGGVLNPAVGVGVNIGGWVFEGKTDNAKFLWIYLAGPFGGSIFSWMFFQGVFLPTFEALQTAKLPPVTLIAVQDKQ